ncbi:MAB_1171c family putative transporter [Micromonospora sp. NPDC051925]|uniref:MAB_1171c family putative transporter n=1 Tax=Micromonospora sp. NPDC051925 TaxID=3364288 RepID=UPI0037C8E392
MIFTALVASVALYAAIYTASTLRGGREHVPARTWLGGSLFCLALALTAVAPGVDDAIDDLIGVPHVSRIIAHALTMWAAIAVLCMLAYWTRSPGTTRRAVRRRQLLACTATVVLVALFLIAQTPSTEGDWFATYHRQLPIAIYMTVFGGILTYALIELARLSLRYAARVTTRPVTRVGLRMFAAGGLISLGYSVTVMAVAIAGQLGIDAGTGWTYVTMTSQLTGIGLFAAGSAVPGTAAAASAALRRAHDAHQCERMEPLWRAIVQAHPAIPRRQPRPTHRWGRAMAWTTSWLGDGRSLSRRVLEIRDGYLQLTPWFDSAVRDRAIQLGRLAGMDGRDLLATVEAAVVVVALDAKAAGDDPVDTGRVEAGGADLTSEVVWLGRVSRALARSPVVADVRAEHAHARTAPPSGPRRQNEVGQQ